MIQKRNLVFILLIFLLFSLPATAWGPEEFLDREEIPPLIQAQIPEEDTFVNCMRNGNAYFVGMKQNDGARYVLVYKEVDGNYTLVLRSASLKSAGHSISIGSAAEDSLFFSIDGEWDAFFAEQADGRWLLYYVQGSGIPDFGIDPHLGVYTWDDGQYMVGKLEYDMADFDIEALPKTPEEAYARVDSDGYALTRTWDERKWLPLLAIPGQPESEIAQYVVGTPVKVLSDDGQWAEVQIDEAHGYMDVRQLAMGEEMKQVEFYPRGLWKTLMKESLEEGVNLYDAPFVTAPVIQVLQSGTNDHDVRIVGDYQGQWYHVMISDGSSGFIEAKHFWDGNG